MAHRRVGDEPLHVGLEEGHHGAVDDPHHGEAHDHRESLLGGVREHRQREAQEAVGAHLQQHAGEVDRAAGRRLGVRIGQPGVQRHHRHLDHERQREGREQQHLLGIGQLHAVERDDVERQRVGLRVAEDQVQHGRQHQRAAGHREEHELDRRVAPARTAPHADDEEHREEHQLPEQEEEEQVDGHERAEHAPLEHQHEEHELLAVPLDVPPGGEDDDRREQRGEHDQPEREAVDAERVVDAEARDPGDLLGELQRADAGLEGRQHQQREQERDEREDERRAARNGQWPPRQQRHHERPDERREDDQRQDRNVHRGAVSSPAR